jgi:hypothetical protein
MRLQQVLEAHLYGLHRRCRKQPQRNASLVRNHDHPQPSAIQPGDGLWDAGQYMEIVPRRNPPAFTQLFVQHTIPIEKDGAKIAQD